MRLFYYLMGLAVIDNNFTCLGDSELADDSNWINQLPITIKNIKFDNDDEQQLREMLDKWDNEAYLRKVRDLEDR